MFDDYDIADYYEDNTLTNFTKDERPIYEKALKIYTEKTGKNNIFIRDTAYDGWGNLLSDHNALCKLDCEDKSDFWRIFDNIRKETLSV